MKSQILAAAAATVLLALASGPASAATVVTFVGYQFGLNPGETLVDDFDSPIAAGYVLGGTGSILTGNTTAGAAPATSATTADTTHFLSDLGSQFSTLSTPALREISFYIGSLDTYNTISFTGPGSFSQTFTGDQLNAATIAFDLDNGNQTSGNTNGRYTFNFSQAITGVRLDSSSNSFEISNIGAISAGIPEPASWAMMILGLGGVGALLRRRQEPIAAA